MTSGSYPMPEVSASQGTRLDAKRDALTGILTDIGRVVVAYSGGVDSSFLVAAAYETLGDRSLAVTAVSPSLARKELDQAVALAAGRGWNHKVVGTHEVGREAYARNEPDRCYWCKTELFEVLEPLASARRATIVVGTNADDLGDYRPGLKAAAEHGARAPLAEARLTKDDVRALSAELGLPTADKPASPCLASRFAYGVRVTPEGLRRIERAEDYLRDLGFGVLRVRDHGDMARIEVPGRDLSRLAELHEAVAAELLALGWRYVTMDLGGFKSGSMNAVLATPTFGVPRP